MQKETGISQEYLAKISEGEIKNPPIYVMEKIADYFDVSLLYFVDEELNWQQNMSSELKKFISKENVAYLSIIKKAKQKNVTAKELETALNYIIKLKSV